MSFRDDTIIQQLQQPVSAVQLRVCVGIGVVVKIDVVNDNTTTTAEEAVL